MQMTVVMFVGMVLLGAFCLQLKYQTILWGLLADQWKGSPRWLAWVVVGTVAIASVVAWMIAVKAGWLRH